MNKRFFTFLFFCSLSLCATSVVEAKLIQILHTNDTHSYLDHYRHNESLGGAARLKSLIDYYKSKAQGEGIKTIVMDAGDFTEGNLYYMADNARKVFEVHNEMGYDVGAMGNHDYLMGTSDLNKILGEMDLKFSLLVANLQMNSDFKNIRDKILPYKEIEIDGIKIGIIGLTTNDILFKWRLVGVKITSPYKAANYYEALLKSRNNDFIIALTHLGVLNDIELAMRTKDIDLIVGGHSHTALFKPSYGVNKRMKKVPIVQAGMHTEYLGKLIIDLQKGMPLKIVSYELVPVKYEASDTKIKGLVEEANNDLYASYGKEWLEEEIGFSDLKAEDIDGARKWAYFITDSIKEKAGTQIAIHTPFMNGKDFPIGNISRRDLINSFPRVFDLKDKYGWSIYTTKIKGVWLKVVFESLMHLGTPLTFSGINMEFTKNEKDVKIKHLTVDGKPVNPFKYYSVAFTEGIILGAEGVNSKMTAILTNPQNTNYKIWATLEEKVAQAQNLKLSKIGEEGHLYITPNQVIPSDL
ncbi:MAG: bifunctional metallophosphatase/5'-nucleotidase [Bacteriovorax sp.]|nr:bifunctional metallophosphatase/5'-nucleotidase [Bacteriovorax sp.]